MISLIVSYVLLQIGIIDPDCRLIGLNLYVGLFKLWIQLTSTYPILFGEVSSFGEKDLLNLHVILCNFGQVIPLDGKGQLRVASNIGCLIFFCAATS